MWAQCRRLENARWAFVVNSGDAELLASLDKLAATEASRAASGGATIDAHSQYLRCDLSLMNRRASEGGDPFADTRSEEASNVPLRRSSDCSDSTAQS